MQIFWLPRFSRALSVSLLLATGFLIVGCDSAGSSGGGETGSPSGGEESFTYSKDAEPVDLGTVSVDEKSSSKIVFETGGSDVDIQEGEVIVSEVPENELGTAPRFLRKAQSVQRQNGQVTVTTEQAALTDAVKKASLDFSNSLDGSSKKGAGRWKVASTAKGVKVQSCRNIQLQNVDLASTKDYITAGLTNGTISFCPEITGDIEISGFSIEKFSTVASGEITYNTDLGVTTSKSTKSSGSKELATFEKYGLVGPVQYTMEVSLVAGYEARAEGTAGATAGIESGGSLTLGAQYKEGSWTPVSDQGLSFNSRPVEWQRNAGVSVTGYIRPEVTIFIYETAGPFLALGPYVELVANQSEDLVKDYKYGAYGGLNGGVGFDIEILEFGIAEYNKTLFDLRTEIAGEGPVNPAPNEPGSPSPTDGTTTSGTSPTLSWNASDPDGDDLTYQINLGTSSTPNQVASDLSTASYDPGSLQSGTTYYWQVEVTDQDGATTEGSVWSFNTPSGDGEASFGMAASFEQAAPGASKPADPWYLSDTDGEHRIDDTRSTDGDQSLYLRGGSGVGATRAQLDVDLSGVAEVRADVYLERGYSGLGDVKIDIDNSDNTIIAVQNKTEGQWHRDLSGNVSEYSGQHSLVLRTRGDRNAAFYDNIRFYASDGTLLSLEEVIAL